ncbi:hypothetical protein FRY74_11315 [Vicingus serpentipes]|uniref:T9SS type A sorting domain-containing protein n=1 Tax=Vicingus serpentipes TaxID=1926625 RepID=A0A5C6RQ67_9FLAO|nr:hypothetical protein [Vicingus serpentipes]TXB64373.1 hypothetical protein FRY74_11315 [Vicingus serpentipes]
MKKVLLIIALFFSFSIFAQSPPEAINYQAVARNLAGVPMVNQSISVQYAILQGSSSGTVVYSETHAETTNQFGLFTSEIGLGSVNSGNFSTINWGSSIFYLQVTVDGDVMPATQLLSVPYALHAKTATSGVPGADGHNSLISSVAEPAGANCPNGGYFIQTWLDLNDDGALSGGETPISYYICNGTDGVNGTNGNDGVGIASTVDNGDGTFTITYTDATTFTTANLTGPMGPAGASGTTYFPGNGVSLSGDTITNLGDADADPSNELQVLSISNDTLFLSNGNSVVLPSISETVTSIQDNGDGTYTYTDELGLQEVINTIDGDADSTNELQVLSIVGDTIYLSNGGQVVLPPASSDTDWTQGAGVIYNTTDMVGIGTSTPTSPLTIQKAVGTPEIQFVGPNTAFADIASQKVLNIRSNGVDPSNFTQLVLDTGSIKVHGLGPTQTEFNVLGTTSTTNLRVTNGAGNIGDVLTSDALGNATWLAPGATGDNWGTDTVNTVGPNLLGNGTTGNPLQVIDNDTSSTNELQDLTISGNTINISNGAGASISSTFPTTGDMLYWNGLNWIAQPISAININDADSDPLNEIELPATAILNQVLTWNGTAWVAQNPGAGADNWGSQTAITDGTSITGDGTAGSPITLAATIPTNTSDLTNDSGFITSADDADNDPNNEIELPATAGTNEVLTWNGSAWVAQAPGAGADNWGSQTAITDGTSITGDGTAGSPITLAATIPTNTSDLTNDSGFITSPDDADNDPTNEIELPATASTGDLLYYNGVSWIANPTPPDSDNQSLTYVSGSQNLSISGGNSVTLVVDDADASSTNEIQTLSFANPNLSLSNGGGTIDLSGLSGSTPWTETATEIYATDISKPIGIGLTTPNAQFKVHLQTTGEKGMYIDNAYNGTNSAYGLEVYNNNAFSGIRYGVYSQVNGGGSVSQSGYGGYFSSTVSNTGSTNYGVYARAAGGNTNYAGYFADGDVYIQNGLTLPSGASNGFVLTSDAAGNATWQTPTVATSLWTESAGKIYPSTLSNFVGVGTASPTGNLHVYGNSPTLFIQDSQTTSAAYPSLELGNTSAGSFNSQASISVPGSGDYLQIAANDAIRFNTNFTERMIITNSGDIGVGTYPSAKLHLDGTLRLDNLSVTAPAVGAVLTSMDAQGNAEWQPLPTAPATFWSQSGNNIYPTTIANNVGIGTAAPASSSMLHVLGNANGSTVYIQDEGLKNGSLLYMGSNSTDGTANNSSHMININRTGANVGSTHTAYGVRSSVTNTGPSSINMAGYFSAAGATTNWGGYFANGNVYMKDHLSIGSIATNVSKVYILDPTDGGVSLAIQNETDGAPGILSGSLGARITVSAGGTQSVTGIQASATGTTSSNVTGGYFASEGSGSGFNRGLNAVARNSTGTNYGVDVTAAGNFGTNYGMRITTGGTHTGAKYGLRLATSGNGTKFGVYSSGEDYNYFGGNLGIKQSNPGTSLEVNGGVTYAPTTYAAGATSFTLPVGDRSFIRVTTSFGGATMLGIDNGLRAGQMLIIENVGSYLLTINDDKANANLAGNALLYTGDTMTLIWNGSKWMELSRSDN